MIKIDLLITQGTYNFVTLSWERLEFHYLAQTARNLASFRVSPVYIKFGLQ